MDELVDELVDEPLLEFREVVRRLRAECPWKSAQTHRSLARYLLEETHETLELLDRSDDAGAGLDEQLRDELGDLLLQVFLHAAIAEQRGAFTVDDVAAGVTAKMVRRNPHVFADVASPEVPGAAAAVDAAWQDIKATEGPPSPLPERLPALLHALKTLERRARAGRPDPDAPADLGERLLALVVEARDTGTDPEQALRDAVARLG